MKCVNKNDGKTFGYEIFYIDFPEKRLDTLPLFGARYNFYLEGIVDCSEFLVHSPTLDKSLNCLNANQ